jgi:hypothetical protein
MNRILNISGTVIGLMLSLLAPAQAQQGRSVAAMPETREIKVISSAVARALADAGTAWAEQNKQTVAMADTGLGRQLDRVPRHGRRASERDRYCPVEGQVGLTVAAPDLRDEQDGAEWRKPGTNLHARLPAAGRAPYRRQGPSHRRDGRVWCGRREMRAGRDRRGFRGPGDLFSGTVSGARPGGATSLAKFAKVSSEIGPA